LNVNPFHVIGNAAAQIEESFDDVDVCLIITFIVTALSQPTEFNKCAICVPAALKDNPFHVIGKAAAQIDVSFVDVDVGLTITFIVTALSHPIEFVRCATCVPAALKVNPFQVIGNAVAQIELSFVDVDVGLIVTFNIVVESHPTLFATGPYVKVPAAFITCVPQVYGKSLGHNDMFVVLVLVALIVTVNVAALSHPTEFVK
jgi:hypothetical protein